MVVGAVPVIVKTDSGLILINESDLNCNDKRNPGGLDFFRMKQTARELH